MTRRKFIGEASERSFTFLNDSQDLELSRAMAKVVEKIEMAQYNSDEAKLKRKKEDEEKILFDPKYDYKWWERNYDDDFTRRNRVEMENEANIKCTVTGRPELATFANYSVDLPYRNISDGDVEACFGRLWSHTQTVVEDRRQALKAHLKRNGRKGGRLNCEKGEEVTHSADFVDVPTALPRPSPEARKELSRRQQERLHSLARPRVAELEPGITERGFTFQPMMQSTGHGAALRRKMAASLPPVSPPPKREPKVFLLAPPAGVRRISKKKPPPPPVSEVKRNGSLQKKKKKGGGSVDSGDKGDDGDDEDDEGTNENDDDNDDDDDDDHDDAADDDADDDDDDDNDNDEGDNDESNDVDDEEGKEDITEDGSG